MKASDISSAHELKRQLDGVRAICRWGGTNALRFGDFQFASGCVSRSSDFPSSLTASPVEAAALLQAMESRLLRELAKLGVTE